MCEKKTSYYLFPIPHGLFTPHPPFIPHLFQPLLTLPKIRDFEPKTPGGRGEKGMSKFCVAWIFCVFGGFFRREEGKNRKSIKAIADTFLGLFHSEKKKPGLKNDSWSFLKQCSLSFLS